ncbi:MAG TPA: biotin/lipoyl-binding protein, partial [Beijerinckia sp.]|nr:biotin/lipoyl-binding protein [Beijerinckia sp.]
MKTTLMDDLYQGKGAREDEQARDYAEIGKETPDIAERRRLDLDREVEDDQSIDAVKIGKDKAKQDRKKRGTQIFARFAGVAVIALLIASGVYYWLATRNFESTDDAFTDGRAISIAPQISGTVVSLDVTDNQFVRKGQPLIHIDSRQYIHDRDSAEGALETAKAQYAAERLGAEIARKNFPALLQQSQAQVAAAQANLIKAQA